MSLIKLFENWNFIKSKYRKNLHLGRTYQERYLSTISPFISLKRVWTSYNSLYSGYSTFLQIVSVRDKANISLASTYGKSTSYMWIRLYDAQELIITITSWKILQLKMLCTRLRAMHTPKSQLQIQVAQGSNFFKI